MTKQEIFDTVVRHFKAQKEPAFDVQRQWCMYRTADGKKCAAGALIPNDVYDPEFENEPIKAVVRAFGNFPDFFNEHITFIELLQDIHDEVGFHPLEYKNNLLNKETGDRLKDLAKHYRLSDAEVTQEFYVD